MLPGVHVAAKDGREHRVGARERLLAVRRRGEAGGVLAGRDDPRARGLGHAQALGVDVDEHDVGVVQRREGEDVADEAAGEAKASGTDENDFGGHVAP